MKRSIVILLVIISIFVASCSPQVTVISQVTVTLPTATQPPELSATPTAVYTPTPAQETIDIGGNLSIVLGEKVDGGTVIDSVVAPSEWTADQQTDYLALFDETQLGFAEGDVTWVMDANKNAVGINKDGQVVVTVKEVGTKGLLAPVWDARALDDGENSPFWKIGIVRELKDGLMVDSNQARIDAEKTRIVADGIMIRFIAYFDIHPKVSFGLRLSSSDKASGINMREYDMVGDIDLLAIGKSPTEAVVILIENIDESNLKKTSK